MEIRVDVDRLREHLIDEYGSAAFSGFPAAMPDLMDIENMNGYELCRKAEELGIDLRRFQS